MDMEVDNNVANFTEKEKFLNKYSYLNESYSGSNHFFGLFNHKENTFQINISVPNFPNMINCHCKLFINGFTEIILPSENYLLDQNIYKFMENMLTFVDSNYNDKNEDNDLISQDARRIQLVVDEMKILLKEDEYNITLSTDFKRITFNDFNKYGKHYLILEINDKLQALVIEHSLPDLPTMFPLQGTIKNQFNKFINYLEEMQDFYFNMNVLDRMCFILDANVTTKSNSRMIKIDDKVYLNIIINPMLASSIEVHFIGPTYRIEKYREKYKENLSKWDSDLNIHMNLLNIFDMVYFPMKCSNFNESENNDVCCSICHAYWFNTETPIISCENERCDAIFHMNCLKTWFSQSMNSKTFLCVTMGICPFCKEKISKPFMELISKVIE